MRSHRSILLILCVLVLALPACQTGKVPAPATETGPANKVLFRPPALQRLVEVERSGADRTPTNQVEVFVLFRNRSETRQQIECRVQFLDAQGAPMGNPSAWQRIFLAPGDQVTWKEASLSAEAAYYHVEVREAVQ